MEEFRALGELLWMLVTHPNTGVLILFLVAAGLIDWRTMRIPNWLTGSAMAYGLVYNAFHGQSLLGGLTTGALGLLAGLLVMAPLYVIRALGAGDVKLMAAAGAFLGPMPLLKAAMFVFVVGGLAALSFALSRRASRQLAANLTEFAESLVAPGMPVWRPGVGTASIGSLPYGVSISAGTILFLVARQLDFI